MKGISITINTIVILALAVIVLLGVVVLFVSVMGPGGKSITLENLLRSCCLSIDCNTGQAYCRIPENLRDKFNGEIVPIEKVAEKAGITIDVRKYCGC